MAEHIEREAALLSLTPIVKRASERNRNIFSVVKQCVDAINWCPAADVRPVVRGKWKDAVQGCGDSPHVQCSICGEYYFQYFKKFGFCPKCGADMRGEDND